MCGCRAFSVKDAGSSLRFMGKISLGCSLMLDRGVQREREQAFVFREDMPNRGGSVDLITAGAERAALSFLLCVDAQPFLKPTMPCPIRGLWSHLLFSLP